MGAAEKPGGPDFSKGLDRAGLADGATLAGRLGDEAILLSRRGDAYYALSGSCTHYGGPLARGLIEGDHAHCPWHHACFDLRTGEALAAPALSPLKRWRVDIEGDMLFVREAPDEPGPSPPRSTASARRIVIIGGGAAGFAAAEMLRRRGYDGALTVLSADTDAPYDRPNLSKDYLAGQAPEEWIPLKDEGFYRDNEIDLKLSTPVASLQTADRSVVTVAGDTFQYDRLLLATGASPIRPPGYDDERVHTLRSLSDARALIAASATAKRVVVIGAGFIGLEAAASLRHRGLDVDVVAPEAAPLIKVLGGDIAGAVRQAHEAHGVRFHLGETAEGFDGRRVKLSSGALLEADLVILGIGVRPNLELAKQAGLSVSNGIDVDTHLRTSDPSIFAAGDVARYPDPISGEAARVEHWVAAQRQGQVAALNMLDVATPFTDAPFFWSNHYGLHLHYVGYASSWERVEISGAVARRDFTACYLRHGRVLAAVSAGRDEENLRLQVEMNEMGRSMITR